MKKKLIYSAILISVISGALLLYYRIRFSGFQPITIDTSFSIKVTKLFQSRGYCYVNDSFQIEPMFFDDGETKEWFSNIVSIGDSLIKAKNSEKVLLIKEAHSFAFSLIDPNE